MALRRRSATKVQIHPYISQEMYEALQQACTVRDANISDIVDAALRQLFADPAAGVIDADLVMTHLQQLQALLMEVLEGREAPVPTDQAPEQAGGDRQEVALPWGTDGRVVPPERKRTWWRQ